MQNQHKKVDTYCGRNRVTLFNVISYRVCVVAVCLTCLLTGGIVNAAHGNRDVIITCVEARNKCRGDDNCSLLLEEMSRTCDESSTYDSQGWRLKSS